MAGLKIDVHFVLGVTAPILVQAVYLGIGVLPDVLDRAERAVPHPLAATFVDVIAIAIDEVEIGSAAARRCAVK
jgi:hypothetical protein